LAAQLVTVPQCQQVSLPWVQVLKPLPSQVLLPESQSLVQAATQLPLLHFWLAAQLVTVPQCKQPSLPIEHDLYPLPLHCLLLPLHSLVQLFGQDAPVQLFVQDAPVHI
jgi:hypothetical protein